MRILIVILFILVTGCSAKHSTLSAPCPDYGKYCHKIPINSWNYKES